MSLYEPVLSGSDDLGAWEVIPCLAQLSRQMRAMNEAGQTQFVFAGAYPGRQHRLDSPKSKHNPQHARNGRRYVCGLDTSGRASDYTKLAYYIQAKYRQGDKRLADYGFTQWGDGYGLEWFTGNRKWTGKDQGHNHIDTATRTAAYGPGVDWLVDATLSDEPWDIEDYWETGHTAAGNAGAPIKGEDDMTPQEHDMLEALYNRVMAVTGDRGPQYIYKDPADGVYKPTANPNTPGAIKNELLDLLNGQTLRQGQDATNSRLAGVQATLDKIVTKVGA